jgi:hypothetical protein
MKRVLLLPVITFLLSGCYRYVPVNGLQPEPGVAYRAFLDPSTGVRAENLLGRDVERFEGRVVSVTDSAYVFAMTNTVRRAETRATSWAGEVLSIPRTTVQRFERRELDRSRTIRAAVLSGAGIVVLGSLWLSISGFASQSGGPPTGPPNP